MAAINRLVFSGIDDGTLDYVYECWCPYCNKRWKERYSADDQRHEYFWAKEQAEEGHAQESPECYGNAEAEWLGRERTARGIGCRELGRKVRLEVSISGTHQPEKPSRESPLDPDTPTSSKKRSALRDLIESDVPPGINLIWAPDLEEEDQVTAFVLPGRGRPTGEKPPRSGE